MNATISIGDSALCTLLLEGLEAYAIKHDQKKFVAIETHAQLWGRANKKLQFKCRIEHASVDSSAIKKRGEVSPNPLALELKQDVAAMFGDKYQHLGTFHTHPWLKGEELVDDKRVLNARSIRENDLFDFSPEDYQCEIDEPTVHVNSKQFSIALVITIFAAQKADDRLDGALSSNLYEFSLGNIKVWLKAQVYEHIPSDNCSKEKLEELHNLYRKPGDPKNPNKKALSKSELIPLPLETKLDSEFLQRMGYYLEGFGRLEIDPNDSNYSNTGKSEKRWFASF